MQNIVTENSAYIYLTLFVLTRSDLRKNISLTTESHIRLNIKPFVLLMPTNQWQTYSKLDDLDAASLFIIMGFNSAASI